MKKNNLEKNAIIFIKNKINFGILNIIYDICINSKEDDEYIIPNNILEYKNFVIESFKNIENILGKELKERKSEISILEQKISNIKKDSLPVLACLEFCDLLSAIISDNYHLTKIKTNNLLFNKNIIIQNFCSAIDYEENNRTLFENGSILLSLIPCYMTKQNYSEYILKSFQNIFMGTDINKGIALNTVKAFKFKFSSIEQITDLSIKTRLKEILELNFDKKTEKELLSLLEELDSISKEYVQMIGEASIIYGCLMELLAVYKFAIDKEYLFEQDFLFKDIFYSTKEMIEKNSFEIMADTIIKKVEDKIEEIIKIIDKDEEDLQSMINDLSYDDLSEPVKIAMTINEYSSLSFEKNVILGKNQVNYEPVDDEFIKEMADDFIDYISKLDFSNKLLKRFKQHFFAYIPCSFNANYLKNYFISALSNLPEKMTILADMKLSSILNPQDFSKPLEENYSSHSEHQHNCDCNHNH